MLMTVQFPNYLVVADKCEIEKINSEPGCQRRTLPIGSIQMPVNDRPVVELLVTKQIKFMAADRIRLAQGFFDCLRKMLAQQSHARGQLRRTKEKVCPPRGLFYQPGTAWAKPTSVPQPIPALPTLLRDTRADLIPVHLGEPRPLCTPFRAHRISMLLCERIDRGHTAVAPRGNEKHGG